MVLALADRDALPLADGDTDGDNDATEDGLALLEPLRDPVNDIDALAVVLALADRDALPLADGDTDGDMLLLRDPVKDTDALTLALALALALAVNEGMDTSEEVGVMERDGETDAEDDKVGVGDGDTDGYHGT